MEREVLLDFLPSIVEKSFKVSIMSEVFQFFDKTVRYSM